MRRHAGDPTAATSSEESRGRRMENHHTELVDPSSQDTTFFPNDQWAYRLVASINQQLPNSQVGNSSELIGDPSLAPNGEEVVHHTRLGNGMLTEAVATEQTSPEICQVPKGKRVSRRGGSFTKEEDAIICSAFMNMLKYLHAIAASCKVGT
ncbi:uncharacterized protein LOC120708751 [Panicum virgatum]|uniref:Uncharacterized protein n=1 Tax=Panicum virgatum TaxID=38727 RepID=A0A8T0SRE8_PANVG|nr:uncharacterized protein LOC120708751 [Panicum virgatum]KAG2602112.1 hypothetical protein PVAP13_5KG655500 [Panicum virgatum]